MYQIERSPVLVFCQSIRVAGPVPTAERLTLADPKRGCASARFVLIGPAAGKFALIAPAAGACRLIGPAAGACKLIDPAAGTPIALGEFEGERGAVVGESLQERSPTAVASAKKPVTRGGARINTCRIEEGSIIRLLAGNTIAN
jgi:hypothetical protein